MITNGIEFDAQGFNELLGDLKSMAGISENDILDSIEEAAGAFVDDLLKLPRPRSRISAGGYTHLVDSFALKREKSEIVVGWGKYYGPFVERGTRRKNYPAQPHLIPTWNRNEDRYIQMIRDRLYNGGR